MAEPTPRSSSSTRMAGNCPSLSFPTDAIERRPGFREVNPGQMWRDIGKGGQGRAGIRRTGWKPDRRRRTGRPRQGAVRARQGRQAVHGRHPLLRHRAADLANEFESRVAEIYPISHQHVMVMQFPVLLLRWLKDNEPEQYARIGHVLSNKDFIRHFLTGEILRGAWRRLRQQSGQPRNR